MRTNLTASLSEKTKELAFIDSLIYKRSSIEKLKTTWRMLCTSLPAQFLPFVNNYITRPGKKLSLSDEMQPKTDFSIMNRLKTR